MALPVHSRQPALLQSLRGFLQSRISRQGGSATKQWKGYSYAESKCTILAIWFGAPKQFCQILQCRSACLGVLHAYVAWPYQDLQLAKCSVGIVCTFDANV